MTPHAETAAVLALLRLKVMPASRLAEAIDEERSATALLDRVRTKAQTTLFDDTESSSDLDLEQIAEDIDRWRREGLVIVTTLDDAYPLNLRAVHDRPPLLFVRGALSAADERSVAVVGTRQASADGIRRAEHIARGLVAAGYSIVSGLAAGIDTAAHRSAIDAGGRTVGVIGTGLNRSYPPENAALQREVGERFAVLSQFWPDQPPAKHTFPMRNAVMSGFALASVIVEASETSGARIQARVALQHGRPVFLLRPLLRHAWAREYADRPGTFVVDHVDEITHALQLRYSSDLELIG